MKNATTTLLLAASIAMASSAVSADYFTDAYGWPVGDNCGDRIYLDETPDDIDRDMLWVDNYEFHTGSAANNNADVDMIFDETQPVKYESEEAFYSHCFAYLF